MINEKDIGEFHNCIKYLVRVGNMLANMPYPKLENVFTDTEQPTRFEKEYYEPKYTVDGNRWRVSCDNSNIKYIQISFGKKPTIGGNGEFPMTDRMIGDSRKCMEPFFKHLRPDLTLPEPGECIEIKPLGGSPLIEKIKELKTQLKTRQLQANRNVELLDISRIERESNLKEIEKLKNTCNTIGRIRNECLEAIQKQKSDMQITQNRNITAQLEKNDALEEIKKLKSEKEVLEKGLALEEKCAKLCCDENRKYAMFLAKLEGTKGIGVAKTRINSFWIRLRKPKSKGKKS